MKNKGFTLIEVVGVLLILSLVFILVFPNMMNRFNKGNKAIKELTKVNIEAALDTYVRDNKYTLGSGNKCLNVSELEQGKYIDKQIKDVIDENDIKAFDVEISDSRVESFDIRTTVCGETSTNKSIRLNGNSTLLLELEEDSYNEEGITLNGLTTKSGESIKITRIIYDKDGSEISRDQHTITNSQNELTYNSFNQSSNIQNNSITNYLVEYEVVKTDSSNKKIYNENIQRKIRVLDTTKPVITVNDDNSSILIVETQYNLNDLFTIEDADEVTTNITTNLSLGVIGKYKVTMTATDKSGNKSTKSAYIIVTGSSGANFVAPGPNDTHKGIAYLNPEDLRVECNEENSGLTIPAPSVFYMPISDPSGCKKFYVYDDTGDTYKMILNYTYVIKIGGTFANYHVKGWFGNPRSITANELAHIIGVDSQDTLKWDVSKTFKKEGNITDINTQKSWVYLDGSGNTYSGWQTQVANATNKSRYAWLYDYTKNCTNYGCNVSIPNRPEGYWTVDFDFPSCSTMSGSCLWSINNEGKLVGHEERDDIDYGIRPVIELPKEIFH